MLTPSRAESGCFNYDVFQSNDDPAIFFTYENWTGQRRARRAHADAALSRRWARKVKNC